jgi:hypothetical protein
VECEAVQSVESQLMFQTNIQSPSSESRNNLLSPGILFSLFSDHIDGGGGEFQANYIDHVTATGQRS